MIHDRGKIACHSFQTMDRSQERVNCFLSYCYLVGASHSCEEKGDSKWLKGANNERKTEKSKSRMEISCRVEEEKLSVIQLGSVAFLIGQYQEWHQGVAKGIH